MFICLAEIHDVYVLCLRKGGDKMRKAQSLYLRPNHKTL